VGWVGAMLNRAGSDRAAMRPGLIYIKDGGARGVVNPIGEDHPGLLGKSIPLLSATWAALREA